jgi:hypothetical protein
MKTKLLLIFFVIMALITSCSITKNTHSQIMNTEVKNQTKYGILSKYGTPAQTRVMGTTEEWVYDLSQNTKNTGPLSNKVFSSSNQAGGVTNSSLSGIYSSYLKITFRNGRVIKWETKGVDYGVKENNSGQILSILLLSSLLVILFQSVMAGPSSYY